MAVVTPTYGAGKDPSAYTPTVNSLYNMIEKIARQIIYAPSADDRLAFFDKIPINKGTTIEQVVAKLAESSAFGGSTNDGTDNPFKTNYPSIAVKYFNNWTTKQFTTTVSQQEIRKVIQGDCNVDDIVGPLVTALTEGDQYEKYTDIKNLLWYGSQNAAMVKYPSTGIADTEYTKILNTLKDVISGMQFVNDDFNAAGILRRTLPSDIRVIMPYKIKNAIDVNELAGVFNLDKAEIGNRIVEIDDPTTAGATPAIYVVDQNAVLVYTRLYEMTTLWNPKQLYMNYFLTVERLFAMSPLFDAVQIPITTAGG